VLYTVCVRYIYGLYGIHTAISRSCEYTPGHILTYVSVDVSDETVTAYHPLLSV
jgi:hypothetical protein